MGGVLSFITANRGYAQGLAMKMERELGPLTLKDKEIIVNGLSDRGLAERLKTYWKL